MGINIRQKGQTGERDVQGFFNQWFEDLRKECGADPTLEKDKPFQRNQNQSAVGGDDLSNPFALSIEVKRQETISIGTWWKQCSESAARLPGNVPILIFKQNRKKWRIVLNVVIDCRPTHCAAHLDVVHAPAEVALYDLENWFKHYIMYNYSEALYE